MYRGETDSWSDHRDPTGMFDIWSVKEARHRDKFLFEKQSTWPAALNIGWPQEEVLALPSN